jgi:hypothetical protein
VTRRRPSLLYSWSGLNYWACAYRSKQKGLNRHLLAAKPYENGLALSTDIGLEQRANFIKRLKECRRKGKKLEGILGYDHSE